MLRRHTIGLLLFTFIILGWMMFYRLASQPASQSPHSSLNRDFQGYLGESTWAASEDKRSSAVSDENNESNTKDETDYYAHIKPAHGIVLDEWLRTKRYFRPAVEEIDNNTFQNDQEFFRSSLGEGNYQYYSVGDMNHDGKEDFAVLLADMRKYPDEIDRFALAIFNAPFKTGSLPAYYEDDLEFISNKYVVFDKRGKHSLFLGQFESCGCAHYYPRGKTYYFKDCME